MPNLIPPPDLDIRDEELIAAQAIARVSGTLTVEQIDTQIETLRHLRTMVESGTLSVPACPELTNANPSSPHTVLLEAQAWLLAQVAYRINLLPVRDEIEFARLFQIELRAATNPTTTLLFTVAPPLGVSVTIPIGTQVADGDSTVVFETTVELVIASGETTGTVAARRTVAGATQLRADVLTNPLDSIAYVTDVTNPAVVDSGSDAETVEEALARARNYQRRAERLVSAQDLEDAILEEVLAGNGIVRAFPFVRAGDFATNVAGHTTVVVMSRSGEPVSDEIKQAISALAVQMVGSQYVYLLDPVYVNFNVGASVRLSSFVPQNAVLASIERGLRLYYAARAANFGRPITRAEIITLIEGTSGVDRIVAQESGAILAAPLADVNLAPYELPRLLDVTLDVVP